MEKRVIIAGSRHFQDYQLFCMEVNNYLSEMRKNDELIIVSGHCAGVDTMAERYAVENGFKLEVYPAEWKMILILHKYSVFSM